MSFFTGMNAARGLVTRTSPGREAAERLDQLSGGAMAELDEDKLKQLDKLVQRLEVSGVGEYVKLSLNTKKVFMLNFMNGVARGLGFSVGTTIVLAILFKILSTIIGMQIPFLTEMLEDLVRLIKGVD